MRRGIFIGAAAAVLLAFQPVWADGNGASNLFNPDLPTFQHSQFTDVTSNMESLKNRFQDDRTEFESPDLQMNHPNTTATDVGSRVQTEMTNTDFANGTDNADFTNDAERSTSFDDGQQSRFSNMRMQFDSPDLQFLNFNP